MRVRLGEALMGPDRSGLRLARVLAHEALPNGLLQSFIQNGVLSGVAACWCSWPQILILFLFILLLEDLATWRARVPDGSHHGGAGLHGPRVHSLALKLACAIPGIMATRVIDKQARDR